MIAAWMLETTIVALLLAGGAAAAQRVFALFRGVPLRWFWAGAIVATFATSAFWLAPRPAAPAGVVAPAAAAAQAALPPVQRPAFQLPALSAATERGLLTVWIVASGGLALILGFALVRLRWEGRHWENGEVGGTPVNISNSLGPAAVGMLRPRVVLPRWVLALDDAAQRAIVAHESEHQRRRDPALLVAGLAALVLMPWNVGMWLAWRGLRLAVEFDCDERVLRRGIDRAGYAQILLGAWGRTRASWLPSAALTRGSGLGSRVQHLMRPEPRRRGMKALIGTAAIAVLVFAACETPAPQTIAGPTASRSVMVEGRPSTDPLIIIDGVPQNGDTTGLQKLTEEVAVQGKARQWHASLQNGTLTSVVADSDRAAADRARTAEAAQRAHAAGAAGVILRSTTPVAPSETVKGILSKIPADSIQSVEVLKGNAATAKYGPRALSGVIIVTTKAGAAGNHN